MTVIVNTNNLADGCVTIPKTEKVIQNAANAFDADGYLKTNYVKDKTWSTSKIADKAITNAKVSDQISASLGKADTALQPGPNVPVLVGVTSEHLVGGVLNSRKLNELAGEANRYFVISSYDFTNSTLSLPVSWPVCVGYNPTEKTISWSFYHGDGSQDNRTDTLFSVSWAIYDTKASK